MSERHTPCPQSFAIVLVCIFCILAFFPSAGAQSSAKPFSKDDVVHLLKGSVPAKRVGELAQARGIEFQITPEVETDLRQAGATDELIATLRRLAPKIGTLLIDSRPGGAHVYVDDEPVGTTSSEGRLKLTTLSPGQHRIRLSLDGYGDDSRDVVIAGASMVLEVTLEAIQPAASASAATKAVEPSSQGAGALPLQDSRPVIYVFRRSKFVASGQHPDVYCDGVSVGQIHAGTYLTVRVSPGKHVATSTGQHITNQASVELDGVNGGAYYIELAVVMGPKVTMALVSKEIGESEIKGLKPR